MSLLVISEILALFVNILSAYYEDSLCNNENLYRSIEMQVSKRQKTIFEMFSSISEIYIQI